MLVNAAVGIAVAAAIFTVIEAARACPQLPSRMPLSFGFSGEPGSYAPKLLFVGIFGAMAIALCVDLAVTVSQVVPNARVGESRGVLTVAAAVVFVAYLQHAIIDAVTRHGAKLSMTRFWIAFAILCGVAGVAAI